MISLVIQAEGFDLRFHPPFRNAYLFVLNPGHHHDPQVGCGRRKINRSTSIPLQRRPPYPKISSVSLTYHQKNYHQPMTSISELHRSFYSNRPNPRSRTQHRLGLHQWSVDLTTTWCLTMRCQSDSPECGLDDQLPSFPSGLLLVPNNESKATCITWLPNSRGSQ